MNCPACGYASNGHFCIKCGMELRADIDAANRLVIVTDSGAGEFFRFAGKWLSVVAVTGLVVFLIASAVLSSNKKPEATTVHPPTQPQNTSAASVCGDGFVESNESVAGPAGMSGDGAVVCVPAPKQGNISIPAHEAPKIQDERQGTELMYSTPAVLSGELTARTYYGPPGYGENPDLDTKEQQLVLVLGKAIDVNGDPLDDPDNIPQRNVQEVTLVPASGATFTQYVGKHITVEGKLFAAFTAHHHTPVLMENARIQ